MSEENYATRTVRVWIANVEEEYNRWRERAQELMEEQESNREKAVSELADEMEKHYQEVLDDYNLEGPIYDFAHNELCAVRWSEIAEDQFEGVEVWVAMWNISGCLPEMEPMRFGDFDSARQAIMDELEAVDTEDLDPQQLITLENQISEARACTEAFTVPYGGYFYSVTKE